MSAGRRKGDALDRYDTPVADASRFIYRWKCDNGDEDFEGANVLEPAAGAGNILSVLELAFPNARLNACDVAPRGERIARLDFLEAEEFDTPQYDLIVTNPPFRLATQFLRRAMHCARDGGYVCFLLRAAFLESKARWNLLEEFPPKAVYFLRQRPKFTGPNSPDGGTDTAMYAWFVFQKGKRPEYFKGRLL